METLSAWKKEFKLKASREPEKYYPVFVLKEKGFLRKKCSCGTCFWTVNSQQKTCGEAACLGGFKFFEKNPAKNKLDYLGVWKKFSFLFKKQGYTPIKRYPVTARWRDDVYFVQASIYDFQPYVVSGEVEPPANPLVVPQFCLRFNDLDNVGITGAHYTGFVMIGQHAFVPLEKWDQEKYFADICQWLKAGLGLPDEEITFHEDAWAGGGNIGPSMEFFSRGLELGNQVYITHQIKEKGIKELSLKVLDMGMGQERNAWFCQGSFSSYQAVFPSVCQKLFQLTGLRPDEGIVKKFLPYANLLNLEGRESREKAWQVLAKKLGMELGSLKEKILPLAALYCLGEHSRTLLVAISDGTLPSNVAGGYNLRVILRRVLSFMEKYNWKIDLTDLVDWHADYLKPLFPELKENLENVKRILSVEREKYLATKQKTQEIVAKIIKTEIDEKKLLELYDSQGINPELIKEEAEKIGKKVEIPDNFYSKIAALHEKVEKEERKELDLDLKDIPESKALYFDDWKLVQFKAKVLKITDSFVLLDQTCFYPSSGGQENDVGFLNNQEVINVFRQGHWIVHQLKEKPRFKENSLVEGKVDRERRKQLTQHHTAAHLVNYAARKVLGSHVNQAGAKKSVEKAHLDIAHYLPLSTNEIKQIEEESNKIIRKGAVVKSYFLLRNEAEKRFGMGIYQGGIVPGKLLRIVEIPGIDAEACGGTHLKNTKEAELIRIISTNKIQDGIVRIEFKAGEKALEEEKKLEKLKEEIKNYLRKELNLKIVFSDFSLLKSKDVFSITIQQLPGTIKRFVQELKEKPLFEKEILLEDFCQKLFELWKKQRKEIEKIKEKEIEEKLKEIKEGSFVFDLDLEIKEMISLAEKFNKILLVNKKGNFVFKGQEEVFKRLIALGAKGGGKEIKQGMIPKGKVKEVKEKISSC